MGHREMDGTAAGDNDINWNTEDELEVENYRVSSCSGEACQELSQENRDRRNTSRLHRYRA
ncbi:hypothetical protein CRG98_038127 [Punica granatum]|uniref:Uncharacterized protein n=1 Tax=Punica granatum TaxID=22663 RepID=A0A2I0ICR5_PUNGR|nr:hypothetical protein CRG98_038127 [Punica granatum]